MTLVRLQQIGLALSLMILILAGPISACACSHHEVPQGPTEMSCHSAQHEPADTADIPNDAPVVDVDCVCSANELGPFIVSNNKQGDQTTPDVQASLSVDGLSVPDVTVLAAAQNAGYIHDRFILSKANRTLLPSRAPPRL